MRPPVRAYGLLARAAREWSREKKVIRGSVMRHQHGLLDAGWAVVLSLRQCSDCK